MPDKPLLTFDRKRSDREMSKPVLSSENKTTLAAPVTKAKSFVQGVQDAGRSFAASTRYGIKRLRGGRR